MTVHGAIGNPIGYPYVVDNRIRITSPFNMSRMYSKPWEVRKILGFNSPLKDMAWPVVNAPTPMTFSRPLSEKVYTLAPWLFDYMAQSTQSGGVFHRKYLPDTSGRISGVVKIEGVLRGNIIVRLYYKRTGSIVKEVRTLQDGSFIFKDIPMNGEKYLVLASSEGFNAVVFDDVLPTDETGSSEVKPNLNYGQSKLTLSAVIPGDTTHIQASSYFSTSFYSHFLINKTATGPSSGNAWLSANQTGNQKIQFNYWAQGTTGLVDTILLENYHNSGLETNKGICDFEVWGTTGTAYINVDPNYVTGFTLLGTFRAREHVSADIPDLQIFKLNSQAGPFGSIMLRITSRLPTSDSNFLGLRSLMFMYGATAVPVL